MEEKLRNLSQNIANNTGEKSNESSAQENCDADREATPVDNIPVEEHQEEPKYSPEVEAALSRLHDDEPADVEPEAEADLPEPLSTEPKKKSRAGLVFLLILFFLALAAVTLCILVEKDVIKNPFPDLFGKKSESSQVVPAETETKSDDTNLTEAEKSDLNDLLKPATQ